MSMHVFELFSRNAHISRCYYSIGNIIEQRNHCIFFGAFYVDSQRLRTIHFDTDLHDLFSYTCISNALNVYMLYQYQNRMQMQKK
jgi:hypothetical protein